MQNYLSISEISELKNVSIQSLRYYEKINILVLSYINPNTNYRYYNVNQLIIIDVITLIIERNIPLKILHDYKSEDGEYNYEEFLLFSDTIIDKKIQYLKNSKNILLQYLIQFKTTMISIILHLISSIYLSVII